MARAGPEGCLAYPFLAAHLRALVIGSAEIGELIMRAFILRRAALLEGAGAGSVVLGEAGSPDTVRRGLASFIDRTHPDELMLTSQIFDHAARKQ